MISPGPRWRTDFALLRGWLTEPLVHRWWHHQTTEEAVEADFGPSVDGADATTMALGLDDGAPVGLVQWYPLGAYPEYVAELVEVCPVPEGALSIDYLIGEPASRGRGVGTALIAAAVEACWAAYPDAHDVLVPVVLGNWASWRALERAGFTRYAEGESEPDNPTDPRDHVVYRRNRAVTVSGRGRAH